MKCFAEAAPGRTAFTDPLVLMQIITSLLLFHFAMNESDSESLSSLWWKPS